MFQKPTIRLVLIIALLLVDGCANVGKTTRIPIPTGTLTIVRTAIPNPTLTPTLTSTAIPSLTPSTITTLPVEDAYHKFLNLLADNGSCRLPCFWGITPGKSKYQQAKIILSSLSSISDLPSTFDSKGGAVFPVYVKGDIWINTSIGFLADPQNNNVTSISFNAQALRQISQGNYEDLFSDVLYDRLLRIYSLTQILTTYGSPSDVLLRTNSDLPPQLWGPFEILLSYPERGFLVHYTTSMKPVGPKIVGCPKGAKLELFLVPSGSIHSTQELLASKAAPLKVEEIFPGFQSIDEVTSLSLDDFVRVFSQPADQCIETPASYWPKP